MALGGNRRWFLMAAVAVVAILIGSLLVGVQTSQARRWVFEEDFLVDHLAASESGAYLVTASRPVGPSGPSALHFFRDDQIDWNTTSPSRVTTLDIASNGALVAAGLEHGGIQLLTGRGQALDGPGTGGPVRDVAVSRDGALVAVAAGSERQSAGPSGVLLYRLGQTQPLLHIPKANAAAVALSQDGEVLGAAIPGTRNTEVLLYDRAADPDVPFHSDSYPGRFRSLDLSSDGEKALLVTDQMALLFARGNTRPVGLMPSLPDHNERYTAGSLAPDGQNLVLLDAERNTLHLHKWGESDARWSHTTASPYHSVAAATGGRAIALTEAGALQVFSVTTGRPLKELDLEGAPRGLSPSGDGTLVFASDDQHRLYRTASGYGGLLGLLPDALVSTLYTQPPLVLWTGFLILLGAVAYPFARPYVERYLAREGTPGPGDEPSLDLEAIGRTPLPGPTMERLTGPIEVTDLVVTHEDRDILKEVTFRAGPGTLTAVVGGSGEGKSTLLTALFGRGVRGGTIRLGGIDPTRHADRLHRMAGFVPQDLQLYPALSALDNLLAFGGQYDLSRDGLAQEATRCLELVGLDPATQRPVSRLSGGERRRVSIATTLLGHPSLLVLDEPTTGLDPLTRRQLWRLLGTLRSRLGVTLIVSTHYLEEAHAADNVVLLEDGRVLASGPPDAVVSAAPGGPALWRFRLDEPSDPPLADRILDAVRAGAAGDPLMDLMVDGQTVTMRLRDPPGDAAVMTRALRQAGLEPLDATWIPMRFEDAFIAYLFDARRLSAKADPVVGPIPAPEAGPRPSGNPNPNQTTG